MMYDDLTLGVKDTETYFEQKFYEKDAMRIQTNYSSQFVGSEFYTNYIENVLDAEFVDDRMYEFFACKS